MIDEEEENWMDTSHLVSLYWMACCWLCSWKARSIYIFTPKLVSSAANTLVVKVASKASDVRDSHLIKPVVIMMIGWPFNSQISSESVADPRSVLSIQSKLSSLPPTQPPQAPSQNDKRGRKKSFPQFSSCCHRWKQFRTQSVPSCSPDNVHSAIPEEVIVEPAPLRSERWRGVTGLPEDQQSKLLESASNYGDSRMTSGIENTACQWEGKNGGRLHQRAHRLCEPACGNLRYDDCWL